MGHVRTAILRDLQAIPAKDESRIFGIRVNRLGNDTFKVNSGPEITSGTAVEAIFYAITLKLDFEPRQAIRPTK